MTQVARDLAPPPPLPPWPGTATQMPSSLCTLTNNLDLSLSNPWQRARGFEVASQLLGQNARRKGELGTAAMATIGNPHKRPIGSDLVAKPQHIGIGMTTRRRRPGRGGWLNPLPPRLQLEARSAFDPVHPFEIAQMQPHLSGRQALARGTPAHLRVDALMLRGRVPFNECHRRLPPGFERDDFAAPAANRVSVIVGIQHLVLDPHDIA